MNHKLVTQTTPKPLTSKFAIQFTGIKDLVHHELIKVPESHRPTTSFGIEVGKRPESITIEVIEAGVFGDVLLAEIIVPVPATGETTSAMDREVKELAFGGLDGLEYPTSELESKTHDVGGIAGMSLTWATQERSEYAHPMVSKYLCIFI